MATHSVDYSQDEHAKDCPLTVFFVKHGHVPRHDDGASPDSL